MSQRHNKGHNKVVKSKHQRMAAVYFYWCKVATANGQLFSSAPPMMGISTPFQSFRVGICRVVMRNAMCCGCLEKQQSLQQRSLVATWQVTQSTMDVLKSMFPGVDEAFLQEVLDTTHGDIDRAVDWLLSGGAQAPVNDAPKPPQNEIDDAPTVLSKKFEVRQSLDLNGSNAQIFLPRKTFNGFDTVF
jgi:hypothetical protein